MVAADAQQRRNPPPEQSEETIVNPTQPMQGKTGNPTQPVQGKTVKPTFPIPGQTITTPKHQEQPAPPKKAIVPRPEDDEPDRHGRHAERPDQNRHDSGKSHAVTPQRDRHTATPPPTVTVKHSRKIPTPPRRQAQSTPDGWYDDYNAAASAARLTHRPILVLFTGSDWCPWCKKLMKDVLKKNSFKNFAEKELILMYVDSPKGFTLPRRVRLSNEWLKQTLGVSGGVPCTVMLSPNGMKLGEIGGYLKESQYLSELRKILRDNDLPHRDRW